MSELSERVVCRSRGEPAMCTVLASLVLFACAIFPESPAPGAQSEVNAGTGGWMDLFDGATLRGWQVACRPPDSGKDFWSVRDGAITCDSIGRKDHGYVWLIAEGEYSDFELELEVRGSRRSPGNSGVQVRSRYDVDAGWLNGPQVDVHPPAPWRTGLIYDETRETRRWIFPSLKDSNIRQEQGPAKWSWKSEDEGDGWNAIRIVCHGTRISTRVNSHPIADLDGCGVLDDEAHRRRDVGLRGHIALQLHMGDELFIQYRKIRLRPLVQ